MIVIDNEWGKPKYDHQPDHPASAVNRRSVRVISHIDKFFDAHSDAVVSGAFAVAVRHKFKRVSRLAADIPMSSCFCFAIQPRDELFTHQGGIQQRSCASISSTKNLRRRRGLPA
jgi:hypothetical protein